MMWNHRSDGAVAVYDDNDEPYEPDGTNEVIIEPVMAKFAPTKDIACPVCNGGELTYRRALDNRFEIYCGACHTVLAHVTLGTKVYG
jgi:hypothetical protein